MVSASNDTSVSAQLGASSHLSACRTGLSFADGAEHVGGQDGDSKRESTLTDILVSRWLEKLLQHFGIHELCEGSEQQLAALIESCGERDPVFYEAHLLSSEHWLKDEHLLAELKRRVVRLAGAQLNETFVAMAPSVLDVEDVELLSLSVEGRTLQGIRYEGNLYRLIETFEARHRLQAFCLAQTLEEQMSSYLITRSMEDFSVWVNIRALPQRNYIRQFASKADLNKSV